MFFRDNLKKAWVFVLLVLALSFVSESVFITLFPLLGAIFLGFMLRKDYEFAGFFMLVSLIPVFVDNELALSFSILYPFLFVILGIVLRDRMVNNKGSMLLVMSIITAILFLIYLIFMEKKIGLYTQMKTAFNLELRSFSEQFKNVADSEDVKDYFGTIRHIIDNYSPFIITFQFVLYNIINLYLVSLFFKDLQPPFCERFGSMQVPFWGVWGINLGLIMVLFFDEPFTKLGVNIALFFLSIYFFQGLSLSTLFFKINKIPTFLIFLFLLLLLMNQVIWLLVSIIGILDTYFNFKKHFKEALL